MSMNPYAPPGAQPAPISDAERAHLRAIAGAQRDMILAYAGMILLRYVIGGFAPLVALPICAFVCFRLSRALGDGTAWLYAVGGLIPLANFICLLVLSRRATNRLTAAGIRVGLFGAHVP